MAGSTGSGAGSGKDNPVPIFMDGLDTGDLPLVPAGFVRTIRTINGSKDAVPILGDDLKRRVANLFPPERLFYADMLVLPLLYEDLITWLQYWKVDVTEDTSVRATTVLAHILYEGDQRDAAIKMVEADNRKYERSQDATDGTVPPVVTMRGQDARLFSPTRPEAGIRRHDGATRHVPAGVYSQDARLHQRSSAHGSQDSDVFRDGAGVGLGGSGMRRQGVHDASGRGLGSSGAIHEGAGFGASAGSHGYRATGQSAAGAGGFRGAVDHGEGSGNGAPYGLGGVTPSFGHGDAGDGGVTHLYDNPAVTVNVERQAHQVGNRFKDQSAKFSGRTEQLWDDYTTHYDLVTRDFGVSAQHKLQFLHNLLSGEALRFYLEDVMRTVVTYEAACSKIRERFLSPVHQGRAKNFLQLLRMSDFVAKGVSEADALEETYKLVARVSKKVPRAFSGDTHRANFLRSAVIGYPWAMHPLSRMDTHDVSFQDLYGELYAALSLQKDSASAMARDRVPASSSADVDTGASVLYGGQARYGVAKTAVGNRSSAYRGITKSTGGPPRHGTCFGCGDPSHRLAHCPKKDIDLAEAWKRRAAFWAERRAPADVKATVLYELWCNLEADVATDKGVAGPTSMADNVSECDKTDSRPTELTAGLTKPDAESDVPLDAAALYYAMTDHLDDTSGRQEDSGSSFQPGV